MGDIIFLVKFDEKWHLDFTKLKLTFGQNSEIMGAHSKWVLHF